MDVLHPVVVHNVPLLAEEREWQIVTDRICCQLGRELVVALICNNLQHSYFV